VPEWTTNARRAAEPTRGMPAVDSHDGGNLPATTTVPSRDQSGTVEIVPRRVGGVSRSAVLNFLGAVAFALSVSTLLFGRLALFSGPIGFVVVLYLSFLISYAILVGLSEDGPAVRSAVMSVLITSAAVVALLALAAVVLFTLFKGWAAVRHLNFFTQDLSSAGPTAKLTVGGVKHALVGTLWMISIALLLTVPIGITSAIYLNEARGKMPRLVRTVVDAMTAFPSVLAGLFVFATWILLFGFEKSGLAAALALSVEMLPIIIRGADVVLRLVPGNLREASVALGSPIWRTAWHVVLPTARPGLVTCVILATARGIGETAPVLLTAGYTTYLNNSPIHGPMVSLPLVTFQLVRSGQPNYIARGFGAALFLLFVVLFLFALARAVGGRGPGNLSARQLRRAMRMSSRDVDRFVAEREREEPQLVPGV
jgi:phosphate transport system permease protein